MNYEPKFYLLHFVNVEIFGFDQRFLLHQLSSTKSSKFSPWLSVPFLPDSIAIMPFHCQSVRDPKKIYENNVFYLRQAPVWGEKTGRLSAAVFSQKFYSAFNIMLSKDNVPIIQAEHGLSI